MNHQHSSRFVLITLFCVAASSSSSSWTATTSVQGLVPPHVQTTTAAVKAKSAAVAAKSPLFRQAAAVSPKSSTSTELRGGSAGGSSDAVPVQGGGTATIPNEVFNLVKSIVGAGVLSLPWGVAAFGNAPSALLPAVAVITIMGLLSAYTFDLIARVCQRTQTTSYAAAWDETVGKKSSWLIAFSCFIDCFAGNLSYSMILADTLVNLLAATGVTVSRTQSLLGVTGVVLLPLCLLKNLASLAPFSLVGITGMLYTTVAMGLRYIGKAYQPGGQFYADVLVKPSFGTAGAAAALSPKALILTCMLSNAYIAHFLAPQFLAELKDNTMPRFRQVILYSFGTAIALYATVASFGFATFGAVSNGLILNNYATADTLMSLARIAVAVSITFSYPLLFVGTREGLLDLLRLKPEKRSPQLVNQITLAILAVITLAANYLTDLGLVASVGGATFGTALVFVYPAIMFVKSQKGKRTSETLPATLIGILGVIMGAIGTAISIQGADI